MLWFGTLLKFMLLAVTYGFPAGAGDPTQSRRVAAFIGGMVADAAAMPLHWIYDTDEIKKILKDSNRTTKPEFVTPSHAPYYNYSVGEFTPFGEQTLIYAKALVQAGRFDPQAIADAYAAYYSPPAMKSRPWRSYIDNATKGFMGNVHAGRRWPHTGAGDTEVREMRPIRNLDLNEACTLRSAKCALLDQH